MTISQSHGLPLLSSRIFQTAAVAACLLLSESCKYTTNRVSDVLPIARFGAIGDGKADDSVAIQNAVNASKDGNLLDFGDGKVYRITRKLELRPNRRYSGNSTLLMDAEAPPATVIAQFVNGQSDNIVISGLTFDANHVSGALQLGVQGGARGPAKNITIEGCTFRNSKKGGQLWEAAIYNPSGLANSTILNNHFSDCGSGLFLADPNNVRIDGNEFNGVPEGNAITIALYPAPFVYGHNLDISNNTGRGLSRSAVAIWAGAPDVTMDSPTIRNNRFEGWGKTASNTAGISVLAGQKAEITGNVLDGGGLMTAIEIGNPGAIVSGNTINSFAIGVSVKGQPDVTIQKNKMSGQTNSGIQLGNVGNNPRLRILENTLANSRNFGIDSLPNDYGGSLIRGNTISREIGFFPEDSAPNAKFIGIKLDSGLKSPVEVVENQVLQTSLNPQRKFDFWAIGLFGGQGGGTLRNNVFESKSRVPLGVGLFSWYANNVDGATVSENHFVNLASVTNGYTSASVKAHRNYVCKVSLTDRFLDPQSSCQ